jgi:hypothetical protein
MSEDTKDSVFRGAGIALCVVVVASCGATGFIGGLWLITASSALFLPPLAMLLFHWPD